MRSVFHVPHSGEGGCVCVCVFEADSLKKGLN
uniref:Uncharacterized protein n=1 Tax=Anguilla anguilla TaxID=7936 RepID=A0A0E9XP99_ANGAN